MAAHSRLPKIHRILYRRISLYAVATGLLFSAVAAGAQEERPQITPGERKVQRKKDAGPRAVAVLRMDAKGKVSLVPIAIMINGKFWDASAYKADPVPMALDSGTVYEGERAGSSLGLFTVGSALHSNSANVPTPWIGTGVWHATGSEPEKKVMKGETTPASIETADQPPRLTHTPTNTTGAGPAPDSGKTPSSSTPSTAPTASEKPSDNSNSADGPPRLTKPSSPAPDSPGSNQTGSNQQAPNSPGSPSAGAAKAGEKKKDDQANVAASDSGAKEVNRPILRRGRPVESFADEEVPGYSKPGITPATTATKIADIASAKDDAQIIPAISDASGPEPRSYTFEWVKGDEDDRRKQMLDLAKAEVRAYVAARVKASTAPSPAHTATTARRTVKMPDPNLENVKMIGYDLWNSNQPIIVFSATAHMPPPAAGNAQTQSNADLEYSILLVTYPDIYNNLHKLYSGVTDRLHLDVTPRMEFIDAVDADGDGRGELLFRETSDLGTGWVIYRATADKLWKMYDSLNPQ